MSVPHLNGSERVRAAMALTALQANARTAKAATAATHVRQADSVSISDAARSLAATRNTVASAPDVRTDRVASLKSAIASGTYSVDSRALATSMLRAGAIGR